MDVGIVISSRIKKKHSILSIVSKVIDAVKNINVFDYIKRLTINTISVINNIAPIFISITAIVSIQLYSAYFQ